MVPVVNSDLSRACHYKTTADERQTLENSLLRF